MRVVRDLLQILEVDNRHQKLAINSYMRFQAGGMSGELFGRFYENLFSVLPEIKRHFQSIDMERQHRILNRAIHTLLEFCPDSQVTKQNLENLALRHATFGLTPRHYNIFCDTLVRTIGELGENDPDVLKAWRITLQPGIDFMWARQEENQSRGSQTPP